MKRLFPITVLIVILCAVPAGGQTKIVIGATGIDDVPMAKIASIILPEAYGKLGYSVEFLILPPARAFNYFATGKVDAYIFASIPFESVFPESVRVSTRIGFDNLVVFSRSQDFTVNGWESLRPYSIGYMRSMAIVEQNIQGMDISPCDSLDGAMRKLHAGRTDVVVMPESFGIMQIKAMNLTDITILKPPLDVVIPYYHYLSPEWASIEEDLSKVLSEMDNSGRLKEVTDFVKGEFIYR